MAEIQKVELIATDSSKVEVDEKRHVILVK